MRDPSWVIAKSLPRNILKKTASVGPEILQLDVCTLTVDPPRERGHASCIGRTLALMVLHELYI